jgi:predicted amidophosphoribosyltransferase
MKLPPLTLVAPSLCPRCDQPAMLPDYCIHCGLQLRQCGNCRGIAGPFDRYCGFCGHELIRGQRRSPLWRLWLLVALIPLVAGIVYGISQNRPHPIT